MLRKRHLSRRGFLKLASLQAPTAAMGACSSAFPVTNTPKSAIDKAGITHTAINPTSNQPTPTIEPTISPIVPQMILVDFGDFQMGSDHGHPNEQPVHTINITRPFEIAKFAVTIDEFDRFCQDINSSMPDDSGGGRGSRSVFHVNSYEAMEYCNWLSEKEGLHPCYIIKAKASKCDFLADGYRLPTESEWEYAARGGYNSQGFIYTDNDNPDEVAWYEANSGCQTHPVGQKNKRIRCL